MSTITGAAGSISPFSGPAGTECARRAIAQLQGRKPSFGLLFCSSKHDLQAALIGARKMAPEAEVIGCTTAGEFSGQTGLLREGMVAFFVASDEMVLSSALASGLRNDFAGVAKALCRDYPDWLAEARRRRYANALTLTLVDGLSGTGEKLTEELVERTAPHVRVVGGAAGDDSAFVRTQVGTAQAVSADGAAVIHTFSAHPWGVGLKHGLQPIPGERLVVTRATGNRVEQINGKPAFEAYKDFAKAHGVNLTAQNAPAFMVKHELGVLSGNNLRRARAALKVLPEGVLACAADIPQGTSVCFLEADTASMVQAAKEAAEEAKRGLEGRPAAGVLVFDCICRGLMLGKDFQQEIDAIAAVFPGVPLAGFLTYGEIARFRGDLDGWHNTTAVVVALPA